MVPLPARTLMIGAALLLVATFGCSSTGSADRSVGAADNVATGSDTPPDMPPDMAPEMPAQDSPAQATPAATAGADLQIAAASDADWPATATRIIDFALQDGYAYDKLGELCDTVGPRLTGSDGMRRAIAWAERTMNAAGFDSVWTEPVTVPYWVRGREWARCTAPVAFDLVMTGLGLSDGTGPDGIEAEILAVRDFDELAARSDEAAGKIVLFNQPWEGYGKTVRYRVDGASAAARHGAVACLIRSVTGTSLATPHTGMMSYDDDAPRIPTAALSVEDAGRLYRMCQRGLAPRVHLYMEAQNLGETIDANVMGEIRGRERPEEILLLGGHLDSWDVGTCAHDDGAGCVITLAAARLLKEMGLVPRRTLRVVLYTGEELGGYGGRAYQQAHQAELDRYVAALESDSGAFAPAGFTVRADSLVIERVAAYCAPLATLGANEVRAGWSGVDIRPLTEDGVPGIGHRVHGERYFDYHHSPADTFDKIDRDDLARNVAAVAALIYAIAEDPVSLRQSADATTGSTH